MVEKYNDCLKKLEERLDGTQFFKDLENLKKIKEKAKGGDVESQLKLGVLYVNGIVTEYEYLQKMIEILPLGQDGTKETQDYEKQERLDFKGGLEWFEKLADSGCDHAINQMAFLLGHRYLDEGKESQLLNKYPVIRSLKERHLKLKTHR